MRANPLHWYYFSVSLSHSAAIQSDKFLFQEVRASSTPGTLALSLSLYPSLRVHLFLTKCRLNFPLNLPLLLRSVCPRPTEVLHLRILRGASCSNRNWSLCRICCFASSGRARSPAHAGCLLDFTDEHIHSVSFSSSLHSETMTRERRQHSAFRIKAATLAHPDSHDSYVAHSLASRCSFPMGALYNRRPRPFAVGRSLGGRERR